MSKDFNEQTYLSRAEKNSRLYREISKADIDGYEVKSNATVIGDNGNNIDVEKIKSILDTHYKDAPKRKSIRVESNDEVMMNKYDYETKEYDLKTVINKAKEEKVDDYNEERNKKLHNTQFDILSNLNITDDIKSSDDDIITSKSTSDPKKLQELINTIALNEQDIQKAKEDLMNEKEKNVENEDDIDPLDMFEDLKGTGDTQVLEGLQEETENFINEIGKTTNIKKHSDDEEDEDNQIDKSFYTKSNTFSEKDFDDFADVEGKSHILVKIIVILLLMVFAAGIVYLVKQFL